MDKKFWPEYVSIARRHYAERLPVDPTKDPMLAVFHGWFRKIDNAIAKAQAEKFTWFDCRLVDRHTRIVLRFRNREGKAFARTLTITPAIMRNGRPVSESHIIDLKIALQSMVLGEGRVKPDPKAGFLTKT